MRFVATIHPSAAKPATRAVKGLIAVHAVKPMHEQLGSTPVTLSSEARERQQSAQQLPQEDRRKACRRINNRKVPVELRSGLDRRKYNLFAGGVAEHIDEEA